MTRRELERRVASLEGRGSAGLVGELRQLALLPDDDPFIQQVKQDLADWEQEHFPDFWDEDEYERGKIRVMKTDLVLPMGDCLKIAKAQLDGGHISHPEYLNLTRRLRRSDKVAR